MTYIKLEDVIRKIDEQPLRANQSSLLVELFNEINSLPSINPESIIEEMIEENRDEVYMEGKENTRTEIEYELLQELLQKFKS